MQDIDILVTALSVRLSVHYQYM